MTSEFIDILNINKDKILSSFVELIHHSNDKQFLEVSLVLINGIRNSKKSEFSEKRNIAIYGTSSHVVRLDLFLLNNLLPKKSLQSHYQTIDELMNICIRSCKGYDKHYYEFTKFQVRFLLFLEDKRLHKNDPLQEFYIDNLKKISSKFDTPSYTYACNQLIKDLESENYESVIADSRALIESYHKHVLGQTINNKTAVSEILKLKIITPAYEDASIQQTVESEITNILDSLVKSISELRNNDKVSPSHGGNENTKYFGKQHAYLFLGATITYLNFITQCPDKKVNPGI